VELGILGPLDVRVDGRDVAIAGAKERAVLVLLALAAGRPVPADRLIDELWGDDPPQTARKSLQVRVVNLRRALGPDAVASIGGGYALSVPAASVDLSRFERSVENGRRAFEQRDLRSAAEELQGALGLWRGPALADVAGEPFAAAAAARLEELRLDAIELRIDVDLALGRHGDVIAELEELVAEHPRRERLAAQSMLALYRAGRQVDALEVFRAIRTELVEQFGIEPGRELRELEQAVLRQDPALDSALAQSLQGSVVVAGIHRAQLEGLIAFAGPLARSASRELIVVGLAEQPGELARSAALAGDLSRDSRTAPSSRAAALLVSPDGADLARLANEQDAEAVIVGGPTADPGDGSAWTALEAALCDVVFVCRPHDPPGDGAILVPFVGAPHDWAAIQIAAWLGQATDRQLRLAAPGRAAGDASRLLASASLVVQRALGIGAEPLLVDDALEALLHAASEAGAVVVGLPDLPRPDGLGRTRAALVARSPVPVLVVRQGLRPGGLAPAQARTRFTWTVGET
jgi:DNA-binding SARP family transcriptional activator